MLKFVILLSAVACALAGPIPEGLHPQSDDRSIGGTSTTVKAYPYQVSIERSGAHSCAGAIYNNKLIITAAHCVESTTITNLKVRAGSTYTNSDGVLIQVAAYRSHAGYNAGTMANDIALVSLSSVLSFGSTINAVSLAISTPLTGASAIVSGWGSTGGELQYLSMTIISMSQCASSTYGYGKSVRSGMICAAAAATGKDPCQVDSGAPLTSNGRLVGVFSWGFSCTDKKYPAVYVDTVNYNTWIKLTAEKL